MGVAEGRGALGKSVKELLMRWRECKSQWRDSNAHAFETRFIIQFEQDAKQAVSGMDTMAHVLQKIKSECGE
jgi:hypothetical protein